VSPLTITGEYDSPNLFGQVVEGAFVEHDVLAQYPNDRIPDNGPSQNEGVAPVRGLAPIRPVFWGLTAKWDLMTMTSYGIIEA
jgi:hypothetical protein